MPRLLRRDDPTAWLDCHHTNARRPLRGVLRSQLHRTPQRPTCRVAEVPVSDDDLLVSAAASEAPAAADAGEGSTTTDRRPGHCFAVGDRARDGPVDAGVS